MDKRRIDGFADGFAMDTRRIDGFATDVLIDVLNGAGHRHSVASSTLPWTRTAEQTATKAWVLRSGCVGEDTSQDARLAEHPEAV